MISMLGIATALAGERDRGDFRGSATFFPCPHGARKHIRADGERAIAVPQPSTGASAGAEASDGQRLFRPAAW